MKGSPMWRRKSLSMKSLLKDLLALLVFLSIGGTAGYVFYLEQTLEEDYVGEHVVGRIVSYRNESVRIPGDRTVEFRIRRPGSVYLYETIKVGQKSGSAITFRLDPEFYHTDTELVLHEGAFVKFTPEGFRTEGHVTLKDSTGAERDLDGSYQATVGAAGVVFEEVRITPVAPVNGEFLTRGPSLPVSFRWSEERGLTRRVIQLAQSKEFDRIYHEEPIPDGISEMLVELKPGTWFWRIKAESEKGEYLGPQSVFTVFRFIPPEIKAPADGNTLTYWSRLAVDLAWEDSVLDQGDTEIMADRYLLEWTRDGSWSDFRPIQLGQKTRYRLTEKQLVQDGEYRVRVTPEFDRIEELTAAETFKAALISGRVEPRFRVERSDQARPLGLEYPPDGAEFNTLDVRNGISFNWEKDREMDRFAILVGRDPGFDTVTFRESLDYFSWEQSGALEPGDYYWKVTGEVSGETVRESAVFRFSVQELEGNVALQSPRDGQRLELETGNPSVSFRWESDLAGAEYRILLFRRGEEKPFYRELVTEPRLDLNLAAPEAYQWQVQLLDTRGRMIKSSAVQEFSTAHPFRSPRLVYPPEMSRIELIGEKDLTFVWESIGEADRYVFELLPAQEEWSVAEPLVRMETQDTTLRFRDLERLRIGNYSVRITARRSNPPEGMADSTEPSVNRFSLGDLVFYTPAVLTAPRDGADYDQLWVRREGIRFAWTVPPRMSVSLLEIFSTLNTFEPVRSLRTTENSLTVRDLATGEYAWRVRSFDERGREAPSSAYGRIRIGAVPQLKPPVIGFPADGSAVNMELFDSLIIAWSGGDEADSYQVRLYDRKDDRLIAERTVKGTRFEFTELEKLDVGTFTVEVQAFRENRDVSPPVTQNSPAARSTFSLYLKETYEQPNIISPDVQYTR